jgi:hypothetical protein
MLPFPIIDAPATWEIPLTGVKGLSEALKGTGSWAPDGQVHGPTPRPRGGDKLAYLSSGSGMFVRSLKS